MSYNRLIIGCGYLGSRAARAWQEQGFSVAVTTRSEERAQEFAEQGLQPIVCNVMDAASLQSLPDADVVLHAVGLDRKAGDSMRAVYVEGLRNVLTELEQRVSRMIYISSTSVYGQMDGSVVDEESVCEPTRENGQICLEAEQLVLNAECTGTVLRLAGIYGPDRLLARMKERQQSEPIAGNPEAWLNLIHVEDAVQAVLAAGVNELLHQKYLIVDDEPITRRAYYTLLAELLEAAAPVFTADKPDPKGDRGFNKRCKNHRMHDELMQSLKFPTIREGLRQAIKE
ncbi:SDR family oxidoreductase [Rubinisphaera italica]|uniref:NAD dependent epimerase/dehydratase family protein n=1 Tax=Rubinisphaera italica TaxID=2527969 RepID=A0A5C5XLB7_9PLAN|nr:SDR family oxidoreductase [Rubinisphaera italica]TWT63241.1 NAD dependent epimerase/dehydratase family protein [Rubinisphaera italica]